MKSTKGKLINIILRGSSLRKDILWTFSSQLIVMLCAFIITKLVSNAFSVEEFGQYNVVRRSASVISFVMLGGMGITLPRYLSMFISKRMFRYVVSLLGLSCLFVLCSSLVVSIVGWLFSIDWLTALTGGNDKLLYILMFAYAFCMTVSSLLFAYYRGKNDFKNYSISQVLLQLLLISSILIVYGHSINCLFGLWTIASLILTFFYFSREVVKSRYILLRSFCLIRLKRLSKTIVGYTTPRLVGDFFLFSFSAFPVVYLSSVESITDVAYYSVGLTIVNMATPVFSFLGVILLPYVSSAIADGTFVKVDSFIGKMFILYIVSSVIIVLLFWLFMPLIIPFFFSSQYLSTQELSRYMVLSVVPQSLYLLYRNPIDAASVIPYNTFILIVSFAVLIGLFFNSSGLTDYAFSFVVASLVQGLLSLSVWLMLRKRLIKAANG